MNLNNKKLLTKSKIKLNQLSNKEEILNKRKNNKTINN